MSLSFVVFDCDGTLVDSQHAITKAMALAFEAHGHEPPGHHQILSVVGISLEPAIARLMPGQDARAHSKLAETYKAIFSDMRASGDIGEHLYNGAQDAVTLLAATEALLGVATGKSRRGAESVLKEHGLRDHFVSVRTADDGPGKPHPHMLNLAMGDVGADPHETIMIGDTSYDMEMARSAGAGAVGVSWGYHTVDTLRSTGAHIVIDDFSELDGALAQVRGMLAQEVSSS
ncbi:MAG: HAD-IA family hydrolase [Candidatus Phaeomarinobacter sp.]